MNNNRDFLSPLRDRREDIVPLAISFLRRMRSVIAKNSGRLRRTGASVFLMPHQYLGNVRELDHVMRTAVLMSQGPQLKAGDLGLIGGRDDSGASRVR